MAEFCYDCFKKLFKTKKRERYILSRDEELCENCGERKHIVVRKRSFISDIFRRSALKRYKKYSQRKR